MKKNNTLMSPRWILSTSVVEFVFFWLQHLFIAKWIVRVRIIAIFSIQDHRRFLFISMMIHLFVWSFWTFAIIFNSVFDIVVFVYKHRVFLGCISFSYITSISFPFSEQFHSFDRVIWKWFVAKISDFVFRIFVLLVLCCVCYCFSRGYGCCVSLCFLLLFVQNFM